jgi:hypothetical protein
VRRGVQPTANAAAYRADNNRQAHDFHGLIYFCALHKNSVDNTTMIPIIKVMVQCNIVSWGSAATV